jgi:hypothetical protein
MMIHFNKELTRLIFKGLSYSFVIKSIGSKHRLLCDEIGKFDDLLEKLLAPLNVKALLAAGGPKAYVDISLKYVPACNTTGDKVRLPNIVFYNLLILL